MSIKVRFFASLREKMGDHKILEADQVTNAQDVWNHFSKDLLNENILISINMEYVNAETAIKEGDEIAFFPPVTGG